MEHGNKVKKEQSLALQEKAARIIPGMTQLLSKRPDRYSRGVWPTYFKKAKGVEVVDLDDNHYLDFSMGGIGATVLGYADEDVNAAVKKVIDDGSATTLNPPEEVALAEKLLAIHPWADMARFARGGGEAMSIAVRIARVATKKDTVLFCGYHGWCDWYLAANLGKASALDDQWIAGLNPNGVPKGLTGTVIPFHVNDVADFRKAVDQAGDDLAAVDEQILPAVNAVGRVDQKSVFNESRHSSIPFRHSSNYMALSCKDRRFSQNRKNSGTSPAPGISICCASASLRVREYP